jgi:hypothetical protein
MKRRLGYRYGDADIVRPIKKASTDSEVVSFGAFPFEIWHQIALYLGVREFTRALFRCNSLFYKMDWRLPRELQPWEEHSRNEREFVRAMCRLDESDVGNTYILLSQNWDTIGYGPDHNSIYLDNVSNNLWYVVQIVKMMEFYSGGYESDSWSSRGTYSIKEEKPMDQNTTYYAGPIRHEDFHALALLRKASSYVDIKSKKDVVLQGCTRFVDFFYGDTREGGW